MAEQDDEERGKWRTNAGPVPRPPGLGGSGMAPRGTVGTDTKPPQRESDLVISDVYIKDGDQFKGPYVLVHTPPEFGKEQSQTPEKPQAPDNRGKIHFHDTGDANENQIYLDRGEVMVPNPDIEEQRAKEEEEAREKLRDVLEDLRAEDRGEEPDTDRLYAQKCRPEPLPIGEIGGCKVQGWGITRP